MAKIMSDLQLRLSANNAELTKGLKAASNNVKSFNSKVSSGTKKAMANMSNAISQNMTAISASFGKVGLLIGSMLSGLLKMIPAIRGIGAAFIATGIGAIITAIVVALQSVKSYITGTVEGAHEWAKVKSKISASTSVIKDRMADVGKTLVGLIKGTETLKSADEKWAKAIFGVRKEIKEEAAESVAIQERANQLWWDGLKFSEQHAKDLAKIAELQRIATDETGTFEDRMKAVQEAEELVKETYKEKIKLAQEELKIQEEFMALGHNSKEDEEKRTQLAIKLFETQKMYERQLRKINSNELLITRQIEAQEKAYQKVLDKVLELETELPELEPEELDFEDIDINVQPLSVNDLSETISTLSYLRAQFTETFNLLKNEGNTLGKDLFDVVGSGVNDLSTSLMQGANSFKEYGKNIKSAAKDIIGSMLAQATASLVTRAIQDAALRPFVGLVVAPILASVAGGIVRTAFNSLIPSFAEGGIVPGNFFSGDKVLARVNSGEMILNKVQQNALFNSNKPQEVVFRIEGEQLVGILNNQSKLSTVF